MITYDKDFLRELLIKTWVDARIDSTQSSLQFMDATNVAICVSAYRKQAEQYVERVLSKLNFGEDGDYPEKCKAPLVCGPCYEVDIHGRPVK